MSWQRKKNTRKYCSSLLNLLPQIPSSVCHLSENPGCSSPCSISSLSCDLCKRFASLRWLAQRAIIFHVWYNMQTLATRVGWVRFNPCYMCDEFTSEAFYLRAVCSFFFFFLSAEHSLQYTGFILACSKLILIAFEQAVSVLVVELREHKWEKQNKTYSRF